VFSIATLKKQVALSAEMGEEMALSVLAAKILAFCWCVSVSVVIKDVILREVTSTFQKVPAHSLGDRRRIRKRGEEKEGQYR